MTISMIRTVLLYIVILLAVRLMGKRQISELQTSELVVTLLISDIAAVPMQDTAQPMFSGVIPILILVVCEILLSVFMLKSHRFHRFVCGKPVLVISAGQIQQNNLRILRMTVEDLAEQLRQKDVSRIEDVDYAIVEPNGKLSVIRKPDKDTVTPSLLGLRCENNGVEAVVVCDGAYSDSSLALCRKTRNWVDRILKEQDVSLQDVFLMTATSRGDYRIIRKEPTA